MQIGTFIAAIIGLNLQTKCVISIVKIYIYNYYANYNPNTCIWYPISTMINPNKSLTFLPKSVSSFIHKYMI